MFYVYSIQNNKNLKIYIGFSDNYEKRWKKEISSAFSFNNKDYNTLLSRSFRKHGKTKEGVNEAFTFQVIEEFEDKNEALDAERFWIEFLRTNVCKYDDLSGMNCTNGGDTSHGFRHSEETKQKLREKALGRKQSEEASQKKSIAMMGRKFTEEHKKKIGLAQKGRIGYIGEDHPNAKLTWNDVNNIRAEFNSKKISYVELSLKYNVNETTISRIVKNTSWKI